MPLLFTFFPQALFVYHEGGHIFQVSFHSPTPVQFYGASLKMPKARGREEDEVDKVQQGGVWW